MLVLLGGIFPVSVAAQTPRVSFSSSNYNLIEREGGGNVGGFTLRLNELHDEDTVIGLAFTNETADDNDYASAYLPTRLTIPAGFVSKSYPILALLDSKVEPDETFTIEITSVSNGVRKGRPSLTRMTIKDSSTPVASFAADSSNVAESAGTRNIRVNLNPAPQSGITLSYDVGGSATDGIDYASLSGSVSVSSGVSSVDIPVAITDDSAEESSDTVVLILRAGAGYAVGSPARHTLTIADNDGTTPPPPTTPVASFAAGSSNVAESAGTRNIRVNLNPAPQSGITLSYDVGGSATSGIDYASLSGSISVSSGVSSVDIPVAITNDSLDENNETVVLTLTAGTGYTVGSPARHTLTITDNDGTPPPPPTPVVSFAAGSSSAAESAGTRNIRVNLNPAPQSGITLSYDVGGSATSGIDYASLSGSITVSAGASSVDIPVAITNDSLNENNETVVLTLTAGTGYTVGSPARHTLTITDNDGTPPPPPTPVVSFAAGSSSAAESAGTRNIRVNLNPAPQSGITLSYDVGGSATSGIDYASLSGSITVSAGASSVDIPVAITNDSLNENNETVALTLTAGTGYTVGSPARHTLTITDNDDEPPPPPPTPVVSFAAGSSSAAESAGTRNIRVNLNPAPQSGITLGFGVGGSATDGIDYASLSGSISVSSGVSSVDIPVAITDDSLDENSETVALTLTAGTGYTVGSPARHTLTVIDDDEPPPPPTTDKMSETPSATDDVNETPTAIEDVNQAPSAIHDKADTPEDESVVIDVLANDTDADGDRLEVAAVESPVSGQTGISNGMVTYTPNPDFHGTDTFGYTVSDPAGLTGTATVTITVLSINDAPVAVEDSVTVSEDGMFRIPVLANDTDADGDRLEVAAVESPVSGQTEISNGMVTYTPNPDFHGTDTFGYTVSDPAGLTDTATVTITVLSINDAPVAVEDSVTVSEDGMSRIPVLANDTDADGDRLEVAAVESPVSGQTEISNGMVTYTPNPDFHGTDTFGYTVSDPAGLTDTATVTITVLSINDAPVAVEDSVTVSEDGMFRIPVLANDTDADGDRLEVAAVESPVSGQTEISNGMVTYTPNPDFHGTDTFGYTVSDPAGLTGTATVTITVLSVNDAPVAVEDSVTVSEDGMSRIPVLANDTDADGDRLEVAAVESPVSGQTGISNGMVTYTPNPDFHGTDTFGYTVSDPAGLTDTATVTITVLSINDAPVAVEDSVTVSEDGMFRIPVLANDTDADGDRLEVAAVESPVSGQTEISNGMVTYTPNPDFHGTDTFGYTVSDPAGLTDTATVTITVLSINDAPVAVEDSVTVSEDGMSRIPVLANDTDADGDRLEVAAVESPVSGQTEISNGMVTYTPNPDFHGTDTFGYTVSDPAGLTGTATVTITVLSVNDGPTPVGSIPHQTFLDGDDPITIDLAPYFNDVDGDVLVYGATSSDEMIATALINGAILTLTPVTYGNAGITVSATDPDGLSAKHVVSVEVDDKPVREVLGDALSAMARSHIASARMTLRRKVGTNAAGGTGLKLDGRTIPLGRDALMQTVHDAVTGLTPLPEAAMQPAARVGSPSPGRSSSASPLDRFGDLDWPSEFSMVWGADQLGVTSVCWSVWGQGDVQNFGGENNSESEYDGLLSTAYFGIDTQLNEQWLTGIAVARSSGNAEWKVGSSQGELSTSLTALHPYLRWSNGRTAVWSTVGGGWGNAENVRSTGRVGSSALGMNLGIVEVERSLANVADGFRLGMRGDAAWSQLATDDGSESIDGLSSSVNQLRLGLDARGSYEWNEVAVQPFGEAHVRRDGGTGQTGSGLELAGGLNAEIGIVHVTIAGRWLAVHSSSVYSERGVGMTFNIGRQGAEGFSFSAAPRWGNGASVSGMLWQDQIRIPDDFGSESSLWSVEARAEYRSSPFGTLGEWLSFFGSWLPTTEGHRLRVGVRLDR